MGFVQEQLLANPRWSNWQRKFLVLRHSPPTCAMIMMLFKDIYHMDW